MYWIGEKMNRQYREYKYSIEFYEIENERLLEKHKHSIYGTLHLCIEHAMHEAIDRAKNLQDNMFLDDETKVKEEMREKENYAALRYIEEAYSTRYVCDITVELDNEKIYFKVL
jgi:hypothetical protein